MFRLRKAFFLFAFTFLALPLAGCESMDTAMHDFKERIATLKFPRSAAPEPQTEQDSFAPAAMAAAPEQSPLPGITGQQVVVSKNTDCPRVSLVEDLSALHQFDNPERPSPATRISSIHLKQVTEGCSYNENNVVVDLNLTFEGALGPRARVWETDRPSFAYPYFVAITTPNGNIAAKEVFAVTVSYDRQDENTTLHQETMRQIIPRSGYHDEANYEILIGFQLTEGELAYNRSLREDPFIAAGLFEQYIDTNPPPVQEKVAAKPMKIVPAHKPFIPQTVAAEAAPAPAPAPAPETPEVTVAEEMEIIIIEENVEPAPAAEPQPAQADPASKPAADEGAELEMEAETETEAETSTEGESAILEENAIITTKGIVSQPAVDITAD